MKYLLAVLLCLSLNSYAFNPEKDKVQVVDQWQCGKELCIIALSEGGDVLLIIADKKGVVSASHRGVLVYVRDKV
jgi:hypothetical protein